MPLPNRRPVLSLEPVVAPPGMDELPYSFGHNSESELHRYGGELLVTPLRRHLTERPDIFVGGDMAVYFSAAQTKANDVRGPDVFVVLDAVPKVRKSWVVWEDLRTPDVVIELLSPSTERVDRGEKMRIYGRTLKVGEYYLFDVNTGLVEAWRRDANTGLYTVRNPNEDGSMPCDALGLKLVVWEGVYNQVEAAWLRWATPDGALIPTDEERAEAARARAEGERARAEAAEVELAQLRARLAALGL